MKKVIVANDHGATALANEIVNWLEDKGFQVNWMGTKNEDSVDYPDIARMACEEFLSKKDYEFGILCCGTGIGISIAANKIDGIRCALPQNVYAAEKAKEHNNANFIAFGGRIDYQEKPTEMLSAFIKTEASSEERHTRRVSKIMELERY